MENDENSTHPGIDELDWDIRSQYKKARSAYRDFILSIVAILLTTGSALVFAVLSWSSLNIPLDLLKILLFLFFLVVIACCISAVRARYALNDLEDDFHHLQYVRSKARIEREREGHDALR